MPARIFNRIFTIGLMTAVSPLLVGAMCAINAPFNGEIQRVVVRGLRDEIISEYLAVTPFVTFTPTPTPTPPGEQPVAGPLPAGGPGSAGAAGGDGGTSPGADARPSPTVARPTATASPIPSLTPSPSASPSPSPSVTLSPTALPTFTPLPTLSATSRPAATDTPKPVPPTASPSPTATPTATAAVVLPVVSFEKPTHAIAEAGGILPVTVRLNMPSAAAITVDYLTGNGSAFAPNDYLPNSGRLIFSPGQISRTVLIGVVNDTVDDPDFETVRLTLIEPVNATLGLSGTVITITDDDPLPQLQFVLPAYAVVESGVPTFTVALDRPSGKNIGFTYGPIGGTATIPDDYDPVFNIKSAVPDVTGVGPISFTLSWSGLKDDAIPEGSTPEEIFMELGGLTNLLPGPQITTTLFVFDDD